MDGNANGGQATLKHMEAAFPLLHKQQKALRAMVEDSQKHHPDSENRLFEVGDLVITHVEAKDG